MAYNQIGGVPLGAGIKLGLGKIAKASKLAYKASKPHLKKVAREAADVAKEVGKDVAKQTTAAAVEIAKEQLTGNQAKETMESVGGGNRVERHRTSHNMRCLKDKCCIVGQVLNKEGKCIAIINKNQDIIPVRPSKKIKNIKVTAHL